MDTLPRLRARRAHLWLRRASTACHPGRGRSAARRSPRAQARPHENTLDVGHAHGTHAFTAALWLPPKPQIGRTPGTRRLLAELLDTGGSVATPMGSGRTRRLDSTRVFTGLGVASAFELGALHPVVSVLVGAEARRRRGGTTEASRDCRVPRARARRAARRPTRARSRRPLAPLSQRFAARSRPRACATPRLPTRRAPPWPCTRSTRARRTTG